MRHSPSDLHQLILDMKFGQLLKELESELEKEGGGLGTSGNQEALHPSFLYTRYKQLKKSLKAINVPADCVVFREGGMDESDTGVASASAARPEGPEGTEESGPASGTSGAPAEGEAEFLNLLRADLDSFNTFFMDSEEDAVIKFRTIRDQLAAAPTSEARQAALGSLVDLHGEMVMVLHFAMLNYAALSKILKKHDRISNLLLRRPVLARLVQQPFFSTHIFERMIHDAEKIIQEARGGAATAPAPDTGSLRDAEPSAAPDMGDAAAAGSSEPGLPTGRAHTLQVALGIWERLQRDAATPSTVLPAGAERLTTLRPLSMVPGPSPSVRDSTSAN